MQSRFISGQMNAKFDVSTGGRRLSQFKKNLNGTGNLNFRDGAFSVDFREKLRETKARLKREPYNAPPKKPTTFSAITASLNIEDGIVSNDDLEVRASYMHITGKGTYLLPKESVDFAVEMLFTKDPANQDEVLADIYGVPLTLRLKGKVSKLDYLDILGSGINSAIKEKARQAVQEKKQEVKQEKKKEVNRLKDEKKKDLLKKTLRLTQPGRD
jgi:AsmA protein